MKKISILTLTLLLVFSCGKKDVKSGSEQINESEVEVPVNEADELTSPELEEEIPVLIFTVQIAALKNQSEDLEYIDGIKVYYENDLTKYRLGNFETYQEAREFRTQILNEYNDAFIQALKNEQPISILEAL
ncbi:SPOR domain-containing protein [uncultured Polaribacter sp.]|uniref:SPOR domain-containing protein n=1 Tax=uncultured Polaribacter sp. TaxID=174711 RepID=UPI002613335D|nr:SPOR domain-containing protein [uncultured Polaribacter sp.]